MKKCEYHLTLANEKGHKVFDMKHRKTKVIKAFLEKSIKEKWVLKEDVFDIVKNTMQFKNIWDYFKAREKVKDDED